MAYRCAQINFVFTAKKNLASLGLRSDKVTRTILGDVKKTRWESNWRKYFIMNLWNAIILVKGCSKKFRRCCRSKRFIALEEVQEGQKSQARQLHRLVIGSRINCCTAIFRREAPRKNYGRMNVWPCSHLPEANGPMTPWWPMAGHEKPKKKYHWF